MTPRFYILKEEVKHFITPEPEELKDAESQNEVGDEKRNCKPCKRNKNINNILGSLVLPF